MYRDGVHCGWLIFVIDLSIQHALAEFKKLVQQPPIPSQYDQSIRSYLDHKFYNLTDIYIVLRMRN